MSESIVTIVRVESTMTTANNCRNGRLRERERERERERKHVCIDSKDGGEKRPLRMLCIPPLPQVNVI